MSKYWSFVVYKFPTTPCNGSEDEFFIEFKIPNCWNGNPRDAQDSHVAYSLEGSNEGIDPCPSGFKKIPQPGSSSSSRTGMKVEII
jgi:hypothetical protein